MASKSLLRPGDILPSPPPAAPSRKPRSRWLSLAAVVFFAVYAFRAPIFSFLGETLDSLRPIPDSNLCPQSGALYPSKNGELWKSLHDTFSTDGFQQRAVDWLAGAVRIP